MKPTIIALIPSRTGSKRIKDKNIKHLGGHPLVAYSIISALESEIFHDVVISTDSDEYAMIARYYGGNVPFLRPKEFTTDFSPDIEWVKYTLSKLDKSGIKVDCFSILRPTSPFRKAETIKKAWKQFLSDGKVDSLRAVEKCKEHPAKLWIVNKEKDRMQPVMKNPDFKKTPWHSTPYQILPSVYAQNASLEIAWSYLPLEKNTITGNKIKPFFSERYEGYDINDEKDWVYAEYLLQKGKVTLPKISKKPYEYTK